MSDEMFCCSGCGQWRDPDDQDPGDRAFWICGCRDDDLTDWVRWAPAGDDALLAEVLTKFLRYDGHVLVCPAALNIDGWVEDLTPEQVAALHRAGGTEPDA